MSALSRLRPPALARLPRIDLRAHPRLLGGLAVLLLVLGAGWLWFRDSPLVAVQRVTIVGVSGPDAQRIRSALDARAHTMSTLDASAQELMAAVQAYPSVKGLAVSTEFPHGMRILVREEMPVGVLEIGGRSVAVANDGAILKPTVSVDGLPRISLGTPPAGNTLTDPQGLAAVALLTAAPPLMLPRLDSVSDTQGRGLVARLRHGPDLIFGDTTELQAKWTAVLAVLADGGSAGAAYIDVTDPGRPAAGGGPAAKSAVQAAIAASAGSTTGASGAGGSGAASGAGSSGAASGNSGAASGNSGAASGNSGGAAAGSAGAAAGNSGAASGNSGAAAGSSGPASSNSGAGGGG